MSTFVGLIPHKSKRHWTITIVLAAYAFSPFSWSQNTPEMRAHFISVGQAEATLLEFPCGAILIDAGYHDPQHGDYLLDYLKKFFDDRDYLNDTFHSVIITHNHGDHTRALLDIFTLYNVERYVDNGEASWGDQKKVRKEIEERHLQTQVTGIHDSMVTSLPHRNGLENGDIEELECANCDPRIRILSGGFLKDGEIAGVHLEGWTQSDEDNQNNHSLVIRLDFGEASFIFTGDLEFAGIETIIDYYKGKYVLDADVYQVGHHGAINGTTIGFVEAISPLVAVISMGDYLYRPTTGRWRNRTAYNYGHPRKEIVSMLSQKIPDYRNVQIRRRVGEGGKKFVRRMVRKRVYATGWEGTVVVKADIDGHLTVPTD